MKNLKLQSAMEYLMTYGWAILIIAVVMVALFSLGILGGNPLGTACLSLSGYTCQSAVLHSGGLTVTLGQATGSTWYTTNLIWVPQGSSITSVPTPALCGALTVSGTGSGVCEAQAAVGTLYSGGTTGTQTFTFSSSTVGTTYSGQIWATYASTSGGADTYLAQMATVTLKSV